MNGGRNRKFGNLSEIDGLVESLLEYIFLASSSKLEIGIYLKDLTELFLETK